MKIKIAHLYYDLLNLYGEQGNVLALKKALTNQGVKVEVYPLTISDKINFNKYDIFYLGNGSKENILLVNDDIKNYNKEIKSAIKKGKYIIATGNGYELFGDFFEIDNQKYDALKIFNYSTKEKNKRLVGDCFMEFKDLAMIIGFQNHQTETIIKENHLFKTIKGASLNYEGYHENNFYGTHMIGPLLIRNPQFTDYIVKNIVGKNYQEREKDIQDKAYDEYIKNFYN